MEHSILISLFIICVTLTEPSYEFTHPFFDMTETQNSTTLRFQNASAPEQSQQICPVYCPQDKVQDLKYCISCDCTVSCLADGRCCADAKLESSTDDLEICAKTGVDETNLTTLYIESYLLVQLCPNKANQTISNDIISKCHQPDENVFKEMVPVYSNKTGKNYRNIFCGMCNNDGGSIVPWKTQMTCDFFMSRFFMTLEGNNNKTLLQTVRDIFGCKLEWKPLNDKARRCFNHYDIISHCLHPDLYSPQLDDLCRQNFSPVKGFLGVYRNEFCLKCGENHTLMPHALLAAKFSAKLSTEHYIDNSDSQQDQSSENEKRISSNIEQKDSNFHCQGRMTYDHTLKRCIYRSCAITELKVGDTCIPFMQTVVGISLDYRFKLLYKMSEFTWTLPKDQIFAEVRHLVLHDQSSMTCAENVLNTEILDNYVIMRIQLTKSGNDKPIDIYEDFQTVQEKVREMNKLAADGVYTYTVEMDDSPFESVYKNTENLGVYKNDLYHFENCMATIAVSKMQFCNTVVVTNYELLEGDIVLVDRSIRFLPGEYIQFVNNENKNGIYICYDLFASRGIESIETSFTDGPIKSNGAKVHILYSVWIIFIGIVSRGFICQMSITVP